MIKKIAQSLEEIDYMYKNIVFNQSDKIKPTIDERVRTSREAILEADQSISNGENPFYYNTDFIEKIFGSVDYDSLDSESKRVLIGAVGNIMLISDYDAEDFISNIKSIYSRYESEFLSSPKPNILGTEITTVDDSKELPDDITTDDVGWYVTSGQSFSPSESFFGPFESKTKAALLSLLIHPHGTADDKTVQSASSALNSLRTFDKNILDLSIAKNIENQPIKNRDLVAITSQFLLEISAGKVDDQLMLSGPVFDALLEFLKKNNSESTIDSVSKISNVINVDFIKMFAKSYVGASIEIEKNTDKDVPLKEVIEKSNENNVDISEAILELNSRNKIERLNIPKTKVTLSKEVYNAFDTSSLQSISIISEEDPDSLSDIKISEFIRQMGEKSAELSKISDEAVRGTLDKCFDEFRLFFEKCIKKDREIKNAIIEFRKNNQLLISQKWTQTKSAEWEFQSRFSLTRRLLEDPVISENIKIFFVKIVSAWFLSSDQKIEKKIEAKIRKQIKKYSLQKSFDEDKVEEAVDVVFVKMTSSEIGRIARRELENKLQKITTTELFEIIDPSLVIDDLIINDLKINSYIDNEIAKFFQSLQMVVEEQSYFSVSCGVCGQTTQVPPEYKDILLNFSRSESQYSFFKENGDFISESDLQSKTYSISQDAKEVVFSIVKRQYSGSMSESKISLTISNFINKNYSWNEVNQMIYSPSSFGDGSQESSIINNIIGHIIRNDILKSIGAAPTGARGIFQNKTLCAASLIRLAESLKQDKRILESLEEKRDYACLAATKGSFVSMENKDILEYQTSAYENYSVAPDKNKDFQPRFNIGYRFSRNVANCPCHIDSNSSVGSTILGTRKYEDLVNLIAIPNIPHGLIGDVVKNSNLKINTDDIYYSPTNENGDLSFLQGSTSDPDIAYLICGKKVSISMFDKDPSSKNYIRNVLKKILNEKGKENLVYAVKILLNYGIEMNDIKPHVESVISEVITASSRRDLLDKIFKIAQSVGSQDYDQSDLMLVKDLGLVCASGHKFTLEQSWMFAKTHSAIALTHTTRSAGIKTILSLLSDNKDSVLKTLVSTKYADGLGIAKVYSDVAQIPQGYITADQAQSNEELLNAIRDQRLYYRSGGLIYIIGSKSSSGQFKKEPWEFAELRSNTQTNLSIKRYETGMQSMTVTSEEGGTTEADIADESSMPDDFDSNFEYEGYDNSIEKIAQLRNTREIIERYGVLEILMPGITKEYFNSYSQIPEDAEEKSILAFSESVSIFSNKFIKLLKMSRFWGKASSDAQSDFLRYPNWTPEIQPNLIENIKQLIYAIARDLNISDQQLNIAYDNFFSAYDIVGLLKRNVSYDKFVSLAGIAQYYKDFSVPFVSGMKEKDAVNLIIQNISIAVSKNLPTILGLADGQLESIVGSGYISDVSTNIARLLYSPYKEYKIKLLLEDAIVNYSGRAITFSYAIDIVNSIRSFYSKYFLNQLSSLYIGPGGVIGSNLFSLIRDSLESVNTSESGGGALIPKILIMDDEVFNNTISEIESLIKEIYIPDTIFNGYMGVKGIAPEKQNKNLYSIQRTVVFSRFEQCINMAISSIDYLILDVTSKPIGSNSIGNAAKDLDSYIEFGIKQRDPDNFEVNKQRILESRMLYGEASSIFEKNAVQYGRISLNPDLVRFDENDGRYPAPMVFSEQQFYSFLINKDILIGPGNYSFYQTYTYKNIVAPYLILLKEVIIDSSSNVRSVYICVVPKDLRIRSGESIENIDMMDILPSSIIRLNTKQGLDFASRYIGNLGNIDKSRLVLADSSIKYRAFYTQQKVDSAISGGIDYSPSFDFRIQQIDEAPVFWPPQNNLLMNNYHIARSRGDIGKKDLQEIRNILVQSGMTTEQYLSYDGVNDKKLSEYFQQGFPGDKTEDIKRYYDEVLGENIRDFFGKIEEFKTSETSKTMITSSSHGLVLPIGGDSRNISYMTNVVESHITDKVKDGFVLTESNIFITRDGKPPLDISWAFLANDPQFKDESGIVRTKLLQSGIVQKLKYISENLTELYYWFKSAESILLEIKKKKFRQKWIASFETEDIFLKNIISDASPLGRITMSLQSGVNIAIPADYNTISSGYPKNSTIPITTFIEKLGLFCDLYNAAQKLNKMYSDLRPLIDSVPAINLAEKKTQRTVGEKKKQGRAACIRLLDPYSMWMIINNPAMSTSFGGKINSEDIEDYKSFIISTFGLQDLVDSVCSEFKIQQNLFTIDDLFNLPSFFEKKQTKEKIGEKVREEMARFFNVDLNEHGVVNTHRLGIPRQSAKKQTRVSEVIGSCQTSDYSVHRDSHIIYPARLTHSLSDLPNSTLNKIIKEANDKIKKMKKEIEERIITESEGLSKEEVEERISLEIKRLIIEEVNNNQEILESRRRAAALNSGEEISSIYDMSNIPNSSTDVIRPKELLDETLAIFRDLWTSETKKVGKDLSWRKIAQSTTDDDGTIIASLYRRWWEAYLKTLAKNYYN